MLQLAHMDRPKSFHSLIGSLAKALKGFSIPKPSIVIGEELKKLSDQIKNESNLDHNDSLIQQHSRNQNVHTESGVCLSRTISTPSCSTAQAAVSLPPSTFSDNVTTPRDILYQPESLLKLLSDETDLLLHSSVDVDAFNSINNTSVTHENYVSPAPISGPTVLRVPEYIKAPARIFPIVIGSETYVLPYHDNGTTVVIALNVIQAVGEFVVTKVVGCGPFDASAAYPDGVLLTIQDEIKVIRTKSLSEMSIEEQLQYHALKEQQNKILAESIHKYNTYQRNLQMESSAQSQRQESETKKEPQYLSVGTDLVGTVVKLPDDTSPGLVSYEIRDDFVTAPFTSMQIPMVGGETVLFDLELNCSTKKTEAVRVKLAPLDANLKNDRKVIKKRAQGTLPTLKKNEKDLPIMPSPPSTFSLEKISKRGMLGKVMSLPTKHRDGVIKFYTDKTYTRADFKPTGQQLCIGALVRFDLNVWFDTTCPFEALNVKGARKGTELGRYTSRDLISDGLPDSKQWSLPDFRHLLLILREGGTKHYDWRGMSQKLKKTQGDIKNFLHILVISIKKSADPAANDLYSKQELDKFVNSINKVKNKRHVCNNENVPLSARRRVRTSSAKEDLESKTKSPGNGRGRKSSAKEKPPSPKTYTDLVIKSSKRPKTTSSTTGIPMVDSITKSESSNSQRQELPSHFTPHQSFVARNLHSWKRVPEVPGEQAVNSVLGDVMTVCAQHTAATGTSAASAASALDYGAVYRYIGTLLGSGEDRTGLPKLNETESKVVLYLLQDLFDDMSKRNLHTHKQFLLQRFFDFTGSKNSGRTPINPYKLKGFLLHLPEPQKSSD